MTKTALHAADLMRKEVVTVGPTDSLREAMALMVDNHVSGLPVLDKHDHCVGVLTMTDVLNLEYEQSETEEDEEMGSYYDPDSQRWENIRITRSLDDLPEIAVSEAMSRDVVSVRPDASLREVAGLMIEEGIHRVLVLDEQKFLHGIISALDFVELYANT